LLADIFAYNVKPKTLDEDVLLISVKRLFLRFKDEKADFDTNTDKYHVRDSSSSRGDRKRGMFEDLKVDSMKYDVGTQDGPPADAVSRPESHAEAAAVNEQTCGDLGRLANHQVAKRRRRESKGARDMGMAIQRACIDPSRWMYQAGAL